MTRTNLHASQDEELLSLAAEFAMAVGNERAADDAVKAAKTKADALTRDLQRLEGQLASHCGPNIPRRFVSAGANALGAIVEITEHGATLCDVIRPKTS